MMQLLELCIPNSGRRSVHCGSLRKLAQGCMWRNKQSSYTGLYRCSCLSSIFYRSIIYTEMCCMVCVGGQRLLVPSTHLSHSVFASTCCLRIVCTLPSNQVPYTQFSWQHTDTLIGCGYHGNDDINSGWDFTDPLTCLWGTLCKSFYMYSARHTYTRSQVPVLA